MTATTCDTGGLLLRAVLADPASDDARLINHCKTSRF